MSDGLCSNCGSGSHEACCARCGKVGVKVGDFCSTKCAREQIREDRLSARIEEDLQENKPKVESKP